MRWSNVIVALALISLGGLSSVAGCSEEEKKPVVNTAQCAPTKAVCTAVESECIALEDNDGDSEFGLRIMQMSVIKPDVLSTGFVATTVSNGVTLNLSDCNLAGLGTFSWLLYFDKAAGKLCTGGAKPAKDPTQGYTFVNETVVQGESTFLISPIVVDSNLGSDGTFGTTEGMDLVVPIYLDETASEVVLLPLKQGRLYDGKLSADQNCIGKYNAEGLSPVNYCRPDEETPAYIEDASLEGYITLEDADTVIVSLANQSLCVLLSGDSKVYGDQGDPTKCARDPSTNEILFKGDWCDATNAAATAGCSDSMKLGAKFAAAAVKINGGCPTP